MSRKRDGMLVEAAQKMDLAHIYWSDGALRSAARLLREAAALLDSHAEVIDEALAKASRS